MRYKINYLYICFAFLALGVSFVACKKEDAMVLPEQVPFFLARPASGSYLVNTATPFKVRVGLTAVSSQDRTVNLTVSSTSGAVAGTHYTLNKTSLVFPAGKVIDSFEVRGVLSQYLAGRRDTILVNLPSSEGVTHLLSQTYRVFVR